MKIIFAKTVSKKRVSADWKNTTVTNINKMDFDKKGNCDDLDNYEKHGDWLLWISKRNNDRMEDPQASTTLNKNRKIAINEHIIIWNSEQT